MIPLFLALFSSSSFSIFNPFDPMLMFVADFDLGAT